MQEIEQFKRQNDLSGDESPSEGAPAAVAYPDEIDLRAEDDELIAAELEAAMEAERVKAEAEAAEAAERAEAERERRGRRRGARPGTSQAQPPWTALLDPRRRAALEGTFDHGEEGYGLWLDPAIQDNPVYAEHWAGHRPVEVTVEEDQIVIRRAGSDD